METPSPTQSSPFLTKECKTLSSSTLTKHSKGLFTPCRRMGLRRRSLKNIVSPTCVNDNLSTPKSLLFVSPVRNCEEKKCTERVLGECSAPEENALKPGEQIKCNPETEKALHDGGGKSLYQKIQIQNLNILTPQCAWNTSCQENRKHLKRKRKYVNVCQETKDYVNEIEETSIQEKAGENSQVKTECVGLQFSGEVLSDQNRISVTTATTSNDEDNLVKTEDSNLFTELSEEESEENLRLLKKRIKEKQEKVRRLRLIHLYKKKHDVNELAVLTTKWKKGCQEALQRLLQALITQGQEMNMTQLLMKLGVDPDDVGYNQDTEDFE